MLAGTLDIVLRRGLDLRERGDLVEARSCFERCLDLARTIDNRSLEACALACIGTVAMTSGETDEARARFEAALAIRTETGDLLGQARSLSDIALCDLRTGGADVALTRLRDALSRTSGLPPGRTRAETLEHLGRVHRDRGDLKEALRFMKDALEVRREISDEPGIATNLNAIGMVYHMMARPEEAFDHLRRAYELRRSFGDRRPIAVTANNLALVHYGQGHLEEAEALLGEALSGFQAAGDRAGMAHAYSNLGLVSAEQGRSEQARAHHNESLRIREELQDVAGQAISLNNLSNLAMNQGMPLDARRFADRSIELRRSSGLAGALAKPVYNRACSLFETGEMDEARAGAEEVVRIAVENGAVEPEVEGRLLLAEILIAQDRLAEAEPEAQRALDLTGRTKDPRLVACAERVGAAVDAARGGAQAARERLARAERALRGRGISGELARIHRQQGLLAASAGAAQAAAERLQRAAGEFESMGNHADCARTLAILARTLHPRSADEAAQVWARAEGAAQLAARGRGEPLDIGTSPTAALLIASQIEADSVSQGGDESIRLVHDLIEALGRAESPAALGAWLVRLRGALAASAVGLLTPAADADLADGRADAACRLLPDGRLLWLPKDQDSPQIAATLLTSTAIAEPIDGTEGVCRLVAANVTGGARARILLRLLALSLAQRRLPGVAAAVADGPMPAGPPSADGSTSVTGEPVAFEGLVGVSRAMRSLFATIDRVARADVSVMILGESGTGKELVARAIHSRSARASKPFVAINCPSIPRELIEAEMFGHEKGAYTGATTARPGKVELADGGTLFLDEVGDMDLATQSKLLRFLQEREFQRVGGRQTLRVDVRVLAATSRDLDRAIEAGTFRADIFYRLSVVPVTLPPLRERREDIPALVQHILEQIGAESGRALAITRRALDVLCGHTWPGNVRELRNSLAHMAAMSESTTLDASDIPASIPRVALSAEQGAPAFQGEGHPYSGAAGVLRPGETLRDRLLEVEVTMIRQVLEAEGWNQSAAARRLGMTETMIRNRIRSLSIRKPEPPRGPGARGGNE